MLIKVFGGEFKSGEIVESGVDSIYTIRRWFDVDKEGVKILRYFHVLVGHDGKGIPLYQYTGRDS